MAKSPAETAPTRAAIRGVTAFSLFGIPIQITSTFWIIAILFGMSGAETSTSMGRGLARAAVWAVIVFVSIMLHELGHALAARAFGREPTITLHGLGGLTHFDARRMSRPQSWLVSFAGPGTGLLVGALVWAATSSQPLGQDAGEIVLMALHVNIGWSLINMLPVLPFDGGHMMAAFLGPRHVLLAAMISAVVGSAAAVGAIVVMKSPWVAVLFGSATVGAVRQIRRIWLSAADRKAGLDAELAKVRTCVATGDATGALRVAQDIVSRAQTPTTKNGGVLALAWAKASLGQALAARELIEQLERGVPVDGYLLAAVEDALGSPDGARARLEEARSQGIKDVDAIKLLIDLYARGGQLDRAIEVATEELEVLGRDAALDVLAAAKSHGAGAAAAGLAARMLEVFDDLLGDERFEKLRS